MQPTFWFSLLTYRWNATMCYLEMKFSQCNFVNPQNRLDIWIGNKIALPLKNKFSSAYFCKLNVIFECLTRKNTEKEHMLEDSDLEKIFISEQCWVSRHFVCKSLCYFTNVKNFRTKKIWTKNLVQAPTILYWKNVGTHRWRWLAKAHANSFRTKRGLIPSSPNY